MNMIIQKKYYMFYIFRKFDEIMKINLTLLEKYFYLKIRKVTVLTFH